MCSETLIKLLLIYIFFYQVVADSLHSVVQYQLDMSSDKSLPHHIAALHVTYDKNKLNITFFCHLVSYFPGILNSVMKKMQNQNHYELVSAT